MNKQLKHNRHLTYTSKKPLAPIAEHCLLLMLFIFLLFPVIAQAGHDGGHGGDVIAHYKTAAKQEITHFELFDYWESHILWNTPYQLDLGAPQLTVKEKIDYVLGRLARFDLVRAMAYKQMAYDFLDHLQMYLVKDASFTELNDDNSNLIPLKENMTKLRFAVRPKYQPPHTKKYLVSDYLYNHPLMTNDVRAGLILHEVIYEYEGFATSDPVRYFNFLISSEALNQINNSQYRELTQNLQAFLPYPGYQQELHGFEPYYIFKELPDDPPSQKSFKCSFDNDSQFSLCKESYLQDSATENPWPRQLLVAQKFDNACFSGEFLPEDVLYLEIKKDFNRDSTTILTPFKKSFWKLAKVKFFGERALTIKTQDGDQTVYVGQTQTWSEVTFDQNNCLNSWLVNKKSQPQANIQGKSVVAKAGSVVKFLQQQIQVITPSLRQSFEVAGLTLWPETVELDKASHIQKALWSTYDGEVQIHGHRFTLQSLEFLKDKQQLLLVGHGKLSVHGGNVFDFNKHNDLYPQILLDQSLFVIKAQFHKVFAYEGETFSQLRTEANNWYRFKDNTIIGDYWSNRVQPTTGKLKFVFRSQNNRELETELCLALDKTAVAAKVKYADLSQSKKRIYFVFEVRKAQTLKKPDLKYYKLIHHVQCQLHKTLAVP